MILTARQIERAPRVDQLRLAWAVGLRTPNPTAYEIAIAANAHHYRGEELKLARRAVVIARERGLSRTRALWEARRELSKGR